MLRALEEARRAGKIREAGYSGEGEALRWAVRSGHFGAVECSVNLCDQRALAEVLPEAAGRGVGVIAKRPLANAPWAHAERPAGQYVERYWERLQAMRAGTPPLDPGPFDWDELALRFAAHAPGVGCAIAGTASLEHLARNVGLVERGPLPASAVAAVRAAFAAHGAGWDGEI